MKLIRSFSFFLLVLLIYGLYTPVVLAEDDLLLPFADAPEITISISAQVALPTPIVCSTPSAIVLTSFDEPGRTDAVAFALGTTQGELSDWFADYYGGFTGYDAKGNAYDLMSGSWSLENVNINIPGLYYAYTTPHLDVEYVLGEGVSLPQQLCAISIQTSGQPDINCCVSARGFLRFPWILTTAQQEQLDQFSVWLRQNGGEWTQLSEGFWFTTDDLQLSQHIFENGCTYDLRVTYPGGQTGMLTFQYDGELCIIDYTGGDRDGGDVSGSGSSTGSQPAPTIPQTQPQPDSYDDDDELSQDISLLPQPDELDETAETQPELSPAPLETPPEPAIIVPAVLIQPNPMPEQATASESEIAPDLSALSAKKQGSLQRQKTTQPVNHSQVGASTQTEADNVQQSAAPTVQEFYSPTQTVISGLRLDDLCAGEKNVVFGVGELTVSIPSELLLALNLEDVDTLSVKLTQPEKNLIMLEVNTSGNIVTELPGTLLRLRYTPQLENADISIWNEAGKKSSYTEFDGEFLRFSADMSGTYTISEIAAASQESHPQESKTHDTQAVEESQTTQAGTWLLIPLACCVLLLGAGGRLFVMRRLHG